MPLYSKSAAIPLATAQLTVCLQNAAHAQLFIVRCNGQHGSAYFPHLTLPQTLHAHIHICIFIVCFDFISLFVCFLCFVSDICLFSFCLRSRAFFLTLYQLHSVAMIGNKLVSAAVARPCSFLLLSLFLLYATSAAFNQHSSSRFVLLRYFLLQFYSYQMADRHVRLSGENLHLRGVW